MSSDTEQATQQDFNVMELFQRMSDKLDKTVSDINQSVDKKLDAQFQGITQSVNDKLERTVNTLQREVELSLAEARLPSKGKGKAPAASTPRPEASNEAPQTSSSKSFKIIQDVFTPLHKGLPTKRKNLFFIWIVFFQFFPQGFKVT